MGNGPSTQNSNLNNIRACTSQTNTHPAQNWNENVLYYSNTPKEISGLFFSQTLGFLELGMEHNTQLSRAIRQNGNYWEALAQMKRTGYDNGKARVESSFLAGNKILKDSASTLLTGLVGGSEKVYPMGTGPLDPKSKEYKATALVFDPEQIKAKKAKVVQIALVTGYHDEDQREAFINDADQLARSIARVYGAEQTSSYRYEPEKQKDRSFGAFAKYIYSITDKLPKDSVVVIEIFTHGNKSIFFDPKEKNADNRIRVETAGVLSWAPKDKESKHPEEINEWEFRQLMNSLPNNLTILVRGNQCLGGQFCEGELVLPKYVAPSNNPETRTKPKP